MPGLNKFLASGVAVIGIQSRTLNDAMKEKIIRLSPGQWTIQAARCSFSVCMPEISQPSIGPKRMQEMVPNVKWGAQAFGLPFDESLRRRNKLVPII